MVQFIHVIFYVGVLGGRSFGSFAFGTSLALFVIHGHSEAIVLRLIIDMNEKIFLKIRTNFFHNCPLVTIEQDWNSIRILHGPRAHSTSSPMTLYDVIIACVGY